MHTYIKSFVSSHVWSYPVMFRQFWSCLVMSDHVWSFLWSCLIISVHVRSFLIKSGRFWSCIITSGPVWSFLLLSGHFWLCVVVSNHFWSCLLICGHVCSFLARRVTVVLREREVAWGRWVSLVAHQHAHRKACTPVAVLLQLGWRLRAAYSNHRRNTTDC